MVMAIDVADGNSAALGVKMLFDLTMDPTIPCVCTRSARSSRPKQKVLGASRSAKLKQICHNALYVLLISSDPPAPSALTRYRQRASLRAELVRLGARWLIKGRCDRDVSVAKMRRRIAAAERWVPYPPASTDTLAMDARGVPAQRIATPASQRTATSWFSTAVATSSARLRSTATSRGGSRRRRAPACSQSTTPRSRAFLPSGA